MQHVSGIYLCVNSIYAFQCGLNNELGVRIGKTNITCDSLDIYHILV